MLARQSHEMIDRQWCWAEFEVWSGVGSNVPAIMGLECVKCHEKYVSQLQQRANNSAVCQGNIENYGLFHWRVANYEPRLPWKVYSQTALYLWRLGCCLSCSTPTGTRWWWRIITTADTGLRVPAFQLITYQTLHVLALRLVCDSLRLSHIISSVITAARLSNLHKHFSWTTTSESWPLCRE